VPKEARNGSARETVFVSIRCIAATTSYDMADLSREIMKR
jgi:hypothetical protein